MPDSRFRVSYILVIILLGILVFALGFTHYSTKNPQNVYQIYIDGEIIGTVESKTDFEEFINKKEESIKKKYDVKKVEVPNGVMIKEVTTYNNNIDSNEEVYKRIVKKKQFTIKGVAITIKNKGEKNVKPKYIYVLKKQIFDDAITQLIKSFVNEDDYKSYMESTQKEIVDTGKVIKDISIAEDITYKSSYISIDKEIFTDSSTLAKYLLYGTTKKQSTYQVQEGDTIETVANANKLNVQEFLIANSNFKSENALLYTGQEVNVGLINPLISVVVEINGVSDEEKNYSVNVQYDENQVQGVEYVKQEGENGLYRVSREYEYINGQLSDTINLNTIELKPSVDKIIVKGSKEIPHVADLSHWAWPTDTPYTITTYFGYRWGSMHAALDIYGPGYGSNIYAANNGTVVETKGGCVPGNISCNGRQGNYILINHNAGNYYTQYMHLSSILVKEGQVVSRGQKIATMGNTGEVYPTPNSSSPYSGTHLHFAAWRGYPHRGGTPFDPFTLYR
ncbi:MAG: M23 family metallopeptidase [Bacilli bacterium]|nr:M23 family metallopeptidase [Bacilli bacterium]